MILFKRAGDLTGWLEQQRVAGRSIGFVPTLGALHAGHISLIDISKRSTSLTVCSIFINPTQFNDPKDFQKYPVTIEKDIYLLEKAGTDVLFLPEVPTLYPGGTRDLEKYDLGALETILEGKYRPGHFQGVCQVMRRLLDLVRPDHLFMGQKDYQQCMVVRRLLELMGSETQLHPCPIVREADGLAMSSRNLRLTEAERAKAPAICRALTLIKEEGAALVLKEGAAALAVKKGEKGWPALLARARKILEEADFRIDYVEIADAKTLAPVLEEGRDLVNDRGLTVKNGATEAGRAPEVRAAPTIRQGTLVALIAAFQGEIRLIDNMIL
jgi:pantoate--beta-alanine ligase